MKKITSMLFLALSALVFSSMAKAEELTEAEFTPDPTEVQKSLSKITIQFSDANWGIYGKVDTSGITLTRKGSTEVLYALPDPAIDYSKLFLEFGYKGESEPVTVSTEGIYTLHVPAGAVTGMSTGYPCAEINVDFTVSPQAKTDMSEYILDPKGGNVSDISTITLTFPDSGGLDWFYNDLFGKGNFSAITLQDKYNTEKIYTAVKNAYDRNATVTLAFVASGATEEVTINDPGTYVLTIPAGMFQKDFTDVKNDQITAEYIIEAAVPVEFSEMKSSPANGERVGRFETLSLIFPHMTNGLSMPKEIISQATVTTPDNETYYGFNPQLKSAEGGIYNELLLNFADKDSYTIDAAKSFTAAGNYVITIPAGTLNAYEKDITNTEICVSFTIDPALNFTYTITPDANAYNQTFSDITVSCGPSIKSISVNPECTQKATISLGETSYDLTDLQNEPQSVVLRVPADAEATPGDWTITIPAGYFTGMNNDDVQISNSDAIVSAFRIKEAQKFDFSVTPADGSTIEFFKNVTVEFTGKVKKITVDEAAGQPEITAEDGTKYNLSGRVSGKFIIFNAENGTDLSNGKYTITIPEGYVTTYDSDNLTDKVAAIESTFIVNKREVKDYTDGILFLNEGWFGHDPGSINFLSNDKTWVYDAFKRNNPSNSLGITSQYGHCFGSDIFVVSKQSQGETESDGGIFTIIDAETLKFKSQLNALPDTKAQPHAFCAWDAHKGYLSTSNQIYVLDLDKLEVLSVVPGTDIYTSFDSNGEMLRYGDYVFAIRESSGVDAIDPATDDAINIPAELAEAFAVTPDGSLYVATRNEANEFIKISPTDLAILEYYDIDSDKAKIANIWSTWRKAPLAADIRKNAVYYVTQKETDQNRAGARTVAKYDFDEKAFTEEFIKLPGKADGEAADWILYGEGVSVDPRTGNILLTAVEAGYGTHYSKNKVFVADPNTGEIIDQYTLDDAYWFPAMTLYPDFEAPAINAGEFDLAAQPEDFTLDLAAMTTLEAGNRHLIRYSAQSLTEDICTIAKTDEPGKFAVKVTDPDAFYEILLEADFQGKTDSLKLSRTAGIGSAMQPAADKFEVFNLQGIRVLTGATTADLRNLPEGIYIVNGKKYIVK